MGRKLLLFAVVVWAAAGCAREGALLLDGGQDGSPAGGDAATTAVAACDPVRQDCPAGQSCDVLCLGGVSRVVCRTLPDGGGVPLGGRCTDTSQCAIASGCFATSAATATCVRYCQTTADCPQGTCQTRAVFRNCGQRQEFELRFCL